MVRIVEWIGSVVLWTCWTEDRDDRNANRRCQVHRATIVADEERAGFCQRCSLAKARLACHIAYAARREIEPLHNLLIQLNVARTTGEQDLHAALFYEPFNQSMIACSGPAFSCQVHTRIATTTGEDGDALLRCRLDTAAFLLGCHKAHVRM